MKKILSLIAVFISLNSFGQDSVKVSLTIQARDIEYMAALFSKETDDDFFDAVKHKFLVSDPPTGVTNVTFDSTLYIVDILRGFTRLKHDETAISAGCTDRVEAILRALNNIYLTGKLDQLDADNTQTFQTMRGVGRRKLNKKLN